MLGHAPIRDSAYGTVSEPSSQCHLTPLRGRTISPAPDIWVSPVRQTEFSQATVSRLYKAAQAVE